MRGTARRHHSSNRSTVAALAEHDTYCVRRWPVGTRSRRTRAANWFLVSPLARSPYATRHRSLWSSCFTSRFEGCNPRCSWEHTNLKPIICVSQVTNPGLVALVLTPFITHIARVIPTWLAFAATPLTYDVLHLCTRLGVAVMRFVRR